MKKIVAMLIACMLCIASAACAETLVVGSSIDFPPYEYYDDETGEMTGIEVEIAYAVAEKMGCELEIMDMQFDSIIAAVVSGKVDLGMSGFTVMEERKQSVDFTTSFISAVQSIVVPENSTIESVDDLFNAENEFKIGVQIGTTGDLYITDDVEANALKHSIERYNKYPDAIMAVSSGKLDCVIMDDQVAIAYVKANEGLKILDSAYTSEEYAICFNKESEYFAPFNAALEELIDDGTVQAIIDKYIN